MKTEQKQKKGFTLVELLVVIAIIGILVVIVFVAINPAKRFQQSRDAVRENDVQEILSSVKIHQIDNGGTYITAIANLSDDLVYMMVEGGSMTAGCADNNTYCDTNVTNDSACVNIAQLITGGYISKMPISPAGSVTWDDGDSSGEEGSGYTLSYDTDTDIITIRACESEDGSEISAAR